MPWLPVKKGALTAPGEDAYGFIRINFSAWYSEMVEMNCYQADTSICDIGIFYR